MIAHFAEIGRATGTKYILYVRIGDLINRRLE